MSRFSFKTFFQELRRREVFPVVALYAAAAWVVIEVGGEAIDAGLITALTSRDLFILAIIGFPLTVIAGWIYDITKHGIFRTAPAGADEAFDGSLHLRDYLLLASLLAVWLAAYAYVHTPPAVDKSIAILPFENRGNDPENAHFAFGIHDDLMTQMGRVQDLTLIAQSSVSQIDRHTPVETVGLKLGVAYVMKGSVERVLDRIRVNVVLVEAAGARQAWSGSYDRELSTANLFDIRDEIAAAITGQLQAMLSPAEASRTFGGQPTVSLEAYQLYIRGRQLYVNRSKENLEQALALYRKALELDPGFALAWVGVADATYVMSMSFMNFREALEDRREAVDRALALDDQLGEAYTSLATIHKDEEQWDKMRAACLKSLELSPNYAQGHHWCLDIWHEQEGGPENQLAAFYRIAQMDPLSVLTQLNIAITLEGMGRIDEAREQYEHVLRLDPEYYLSYQWYGKTELWYGNLAKAAALLRRSIALEPGNREALNALLGVYESLGEFDLAAGLIDSFLELPGVNTEARAEWTRTLLNSGLSLARGDPAGVIRLVEESSPAAQQAPLVQANYAWAQLIMGDMEKAREAWFKGEPDFRNPNDEEQLVQSHIGCVTAGLLLATGDEKKGREILARTTHYFEEVLPQDDIYRWRTFSCYLVEGKPEKALAEYEKWVGRGQINGWARDKQLPWWDPMRDTPRFKALDDRINGLLAEQRELLRRMDE